MYCRHSPDAESALNYFGVQRTKNNKGVTIPSQIRYVHYFDK
jgi:phosphatidylinositol-3,4,5-trisphosphate 3-phosphatase/dual-specificity protein phosphatase PTEN